MAGSSTRSIDDGQLERLASEPARPLFPLLGQADAMVPLVVVLAFLPTLYAVGHRTLTEAGAQQGLLSLECLSARGSGEFIDPSADDLPASLSYQPLLMNWLTAVALQMFGVGHPAGLVASAYLCTAGLIIAAYMLARRFGGERLGLVTALLLAFNPHVLRLAQEPVPQSAATMFAVLALAGAVAHWQKSGALASYQLLLGGIALGLCLLAGGPVALAVVLILLGYAAWWKVDGFRRSRSAEFVDRSQLSRRTAVRSVLVLAATGFAVGGWRTLLMGSRYGMAFWKSWLGIPATQAVNVAEPAVGSPFIDALLELNSLVLPVFVLALAGVVVIVADLARRDVDPGHRHSGLLVFWALGALVLWSTSGGEAPSGGTLPAFWKHLLIVPLMMLGATGLLAIIDRRIPFAAAAAAGLLALFDVVLLAGRRVAAAGLAELVDDSISGRVMALVVILLALAALAALTAQIVRAGDAWRRALLAALCLIIVSANCLWGAVGVRRSRTVDRELEDIRAALAKLPAVRRCTLLTGQQATASAAAPLKFTLRSLWPEAELDSATSWESIATRRATEGPSGDAEAEIVITWSARGQSRPTVPAGTLRSAISPLLYRGLDVFAYVTDGPSR